MILAVALGFAAGVLLPLALRSLAVLVLTKHARHIRTGDAYVVVDDDALAKLPGALSGTWEPAIIYSRGGRNYVRLAANFAAQFALVSSPRTRLDAWIEKLP